MNSQEIVGLIAPVTALVLAVTFVLIGSTREYDRYSAPLGFAFILIAAGLFAPRFFAEVNPIGYELAAITLCTLAFFPVAKSLLIRHDLEPPWAIICLISGVWLASAYYLIFVQNLPNLKYAIGSFTAAMLIIILLRSLRQAHSKKLIDRLIFGLLIMIAVQMIAGPFFTLSDAAVAKTLTSQALGEWSVSNFLVGFSILALGLALLAARILDVLEEIKVEARTDLMTGLINRFGFDIEASDFVSRANFDKQPLSFMICDIDHFRSVNHKFGHIAGDSAIKCTCNVLRSMVGNKYLIGRLGGEEFGILMPNTNLQMARLLAESIRTSVRSGNLPEPLEKHRLTVSFGVACLKHNEDYRELFSRADAALYRAKSNGCNCVMVDGHISTKHNIDRVKFA